ncbi:hypothetical protein SAMN05720471_10769 [Fibrobacter sp. UWP2]|nr:hypothetical protein SAMN05720471_10769 [Fibrobacter sp. UWP2]
MALWATSANASEFFESKSSADCGGLFLLHTDDKHFAAKACGISESLRLQNVEVFGGYYKYSIYGRYTDEWTLKGENDGDVGNAGFRAHFKYLTLGVDVNSLPFVHSKLTLHSDDSSFYAGTLMGRGEPEIGTLRWISQNKSDIVSEIAVDWQTHLFYRGISAGAKIRNSRLELSGLYLTSDPQNPEKEYYIRDSVSAMVLRSRFATNLGGEILSANYTFADADIYLFGIFHQEQSHKRFLYVPLEFQLNYAQLQWAKEQMAFHLDFIYANAQMDANPDRFYETLAPNRALPPSILKALSFTFLQKAFRVNTDLDATGILGGGKYLWALGSRRSFKPSINLDFYYAHGEVDILRTSETTVLFATSSIDEHFVRKIRSLGTILSPGFEFKFGEHVLFSGGATQIIPFFISYNEIRPGEIYEDAETEAPQGGKAGNNGSKKEEEPQKDGNILGDVPQKTSAAFRNGFAAHFSVSIRF